MRDPEDLQSNERWKHTSSTGADVVFFRASRACYVPTALTYRYQNALVDFSCLYGEEAYDHCDCSASAATSILLQGDYSRRHARHLVNEPESIECGTRKAS